MSARLYLALLHHPVMNREGKVVTTSITNLDIHDIARSACTFGVSTFFVAHPIPGLRALCERVVWHWQSGHGGRSNPSRREAIGLVRIEADLEHVLTAVEQATGQMPVLIATSARPLGRKVMQVGELRERMATGEDPVLLILGTGYGLAEKVLDRCDALLEPLKGVGPYNHLSVRSAAAILLDRLRSPGREEYAERSQRETTP